MIEHVISPEQAAIYVDRAYAWLEGFGKGFDRNDRSTWKVQNLPEFSKCVSNSAHYPNRIPHGRH